MMFQPSSRNSWEENPDTEHQKCDARTTWNYKDIKIHTDKTDGREEL